MTEDAQVKEGRRNHYVPQFYLSGFTETREKGGRLYCLDKTYAQMKPKTPAAIGYQKGLWTDAIEDALQEDEDRQAPVVRILDKQLTGLTDEYREAVIGLTARILSGTPKWFSKRADATVEHIREIVRRHKIARWLLGGRSCLTKVLFGKKWRHVRNGFHTGSTMFLQETKGRIESLHKKWWCLLYAPRGVVEFITSDAPVCCNSSGPMQMHGGAKKYGLFDNPDVLIFFPLTSHVALFGICAPLPYRYMIVPRDMVAFINTLVLSLSHRYVYAQNNELFWIMPDKIVGGVKQYCDHLKSKKPMTITWDGRAAILRQVYDGLKVWLPPTKTDTLGPFSLNPGEWPKRTKRPFRKRFGASSRLCIAMAKNVALLLVEIPLALLVIALCSPVALLRWLLRRFRSRSGRHKNSPLP